jgi:hypothetical protein
MSIIGSSSIFSQGSVGPQGPVGPKGPTGPTGPDGNPAQGCGNLSKGNTAPYIKDITQTNNPINPETVFSFSDNTNISFDYPEIRGNTLFNSYGVNAKTTQYPSIFIGISGSDAGSTLFFRGIQSVAASLTVTSDINHVYINANENPYNAKGFISGELLYFTGKTEDPILEGITGQTNPLRFKNNTNHFELNTKTSVNSKTHTITSTVLGSSGQYIDIRDGGVFYIQTPNGIIGITGMTGSPGQTGTILSFTIVTQSDYLWQFPKNIWFEKGENYLGCGETIINLTSTNNGNHWNAVVFGRGFKSASVLKCQSDWDIGSCYYSGGQTCNNYVTRADCRTSDGIFCLEACSQEWEVFDTGACCINGICKNGVSEFLCTKYGGRWWSPIEATLGCDSFTCWDPCIDPPQSCCPPAGATCLDRYTKSECDLIGGVWSQEACNPYSCTILGGERGACCLSPIQCQDMTYLECKNRDGIFTGIGETCSEINCDCFEYTSASIGCGQSLNFGGTGAKFTEKIIDLRNLQFSGNENICFRYKPYNIKDRFLVLATKSGNNENETNNFRKAPAANYYDNYLNFIRSDLSHPRFFVENDADGVNHNSILWDSGCTGFNGNKTVTIPITSEDVETGNTASNWYKKLRLWILAGCSAGSGQGPNQTIWEVGITCEGCTATSPSTALPEQNGNNSSTKSINTTQGTFTIIG